MLKVSILATDNRENDHNYSAPAPYFGTAPSALFEGFSKIQGIEVHVLSCTKQAMSSPAKLANNIWFHSLVVPKFGWLRTGYSGCILAVRKKLKEIKPDIVHGQGTERDCSISAVFSGYPNVLTIHGNMTELARIFHARIGSFYWWTAKLENFTLPRTLGVLCNSHYTQSLASPRSKKSWLVPNPIRDSFYKIDNMNKPLKSMSAYKLDELVVFCNKLGMASANDGKKANKKCLYEMLVQYFVL